MSEAGQLTPERLHYLLTQRVIETGYAPEVKNLATLARASEQEAASCLTALAAMHGVILEPNSLRIWSLHPFALMPTAFWVTAGGRGWWANCAWCSLGIGAALGIDFSVQTSSGAESQPLKFDVVSRRISGANVLMHFPYPPVRWWDNPYCPCGNILFFSSESEVGQWCRRHGRPRGAVLPSDTSWALAQLWFGDYASPQWRRKTAQQAMAIFSQLKLDPAFWSLPEDFR